MELNNLGKKFSKGLSTIMGTTMTLTDNKIKGITKVSRSLENKRISLKKLLQKVIVQKYNYSVFFFHLKELLYHNAKCVCTNS